MTDTSATRTEPFAIPELAERWHCSTETVLRKIRKGELPCIEIGPRNLLVPANDVMEYESARTVRRVSSLRVVQETPTPDTGPSPGHTEPQDSDRAAASSQRARLRRHAQGTR